MSVAAYASLISLAQDLCSVEYLLSCRRIDLSQKQLQNLQDIIHPLLGFLEDPPQNLTSELETLIREIPGIVVDSEFVIDKQVVEQLVNGVNKPKAQASRQSWFQVQLLQGFISCLSFNNNLVLNKSEDLTLGKVIRKLESIYNGLLMEKVEPQNVSGSSSMNQIHSIASSTTKWNARTTPMGFEKHVKWVVDHLCSHQKGLQVIPIAGMGGIGKTTLIRYAFEKPQIKERFIRHLWCTISQDYNVVNVLQNLLGDKSNEGNQRELGLKLYQGLYGLRYLLVLDDMWTYDAWEQLKSHLPDNRNGSRVIVTTRMSSVAKLLNPHRCFILDFLDDRTSWDLLCETIFGEGDCPDELIGIGKSIAKSCKGLPMSLVTIGGLLSKSKKTAEYWENVAENVSRFASYEDDERCMRILHLSYSSLPIHLKPCFLYIAIFPSRKDVKVIELIRQWIAQGLVKQEGDKILEDVAEEYLKELIDRNLILIRRLNHFGKIKGCAIHDLFRELCLKEIEKENFFAIATPKLFGRPYRWGLPLEGDCIMCRQFASQVQSYHLSQCGVPGLVALRGVRFCQRCSTKYRYVDRSRFVVLADMLYTMVLNPTTSRYMKVSFLSGNSVVPPPSSILYLWNLQFLKLGRSSHRPSLPVEIWELHRLRHLEADSFSLPEPKVKCHTPLNDLQILYTSQLILRKAIIERISNLKKLRLFHYYDDGGFQSFVQLRSLHISATRMYEISLKSIAFPYSLKKLCLDLLKCDWKEMSSIGSLSNLQVLNLKNFYGSGNEWNVMDGEFPSLKLLILGNTDLNVWRVEDHHFPELEKLVIRGDSCIEVPMSFGEVASLRSIHLENLGTLHVRTYKSVLRIHEEQQRNGHFKFEMYIGKRAVTVSGYDLEDDVTWDESGGHFPEFESVDV